MSFHVCSHPQEWSTFLADVPSSHLLQSWDWGALKSAFGWTPKRLIIEDDGQAVAGAQILFRKVGPFSLGYIPKGPLLLDQSAETQQLLLAALDSICRDMRALSLKIEPPSLETDRSIWNWLETAEFSKEAKPIQPRRTIIVDVAREPEQILASFKSKWRYNTRLSRRHGIEIRRQGIEALDAFYSIMQVTGERDGFGIHSKAYYARAMEAFAQEGKVTLLMAYLENVPIAGIMVPAYCHEAIYMYGGSLSEHRQHMPNHQLQYEAMVWAHENGCSRYDLWGIPDADTNAESTDLGGVGRFKSGFGGEVERYVGAYEHVYRPRLFGLTQTAMSLRKRLLQR